MIIVGFVLVASSYWIEFIGTTATADFGTFARAFVIQGAGFSLLFSPIASTVLSSIPPEDFTRGVAIFKLSLATGGSFAGTMFGVVIDHRAALHQAQIADAMTLANPGLQSYLFSGGKASLLPALAVSQSQILAYGDAALYTAILVLCVAPLALVLRPPRPPQPDDAQRPAA
jgi:DHA2 family multidrug resistance protein